jgi:hypothetical protein
MRCEIEKLKGTKGLNLYAVLVRSAKDTSMDTVEIWRAEKDQDIDNEMHSMGLSDEMYKTTWIGHIP